MRFPICRRSVFCPLVNRVGSRRGRSGPKTDVTAGVVATTDSAGERGLFFFLCVRCTINLSAKPIGERRLVTWVINQKRRRSVYRWMDGLIKRAPGYNALYNTLSEWLTLTRESEQTDRAEVV